MIKRSKICPNKKISLQNLTSQQSQPAAQFRRFIETLLEYLDMGLDSAAEICTHADSCDTQVSLIHDSQMCFFVVMSPLLCPTGPLVLQAHSTNADQTSNATTAGLQYVCFGIGNSICYLKLDPSEVIILQYYYETTTTLP